MAINIDMRVDMLSFIVHSLCLIFGCISWCISCIMALWTGIISRNQCWKFGFHEYICWMLQYHKRFWTNHSFPFVTFSIQQKQSGLLSAKIHMRRDDFEADTDLLADLCLRDLQEALVDEEAHWSISNEHVWHLQHHLYAMSSHIMGSAKMRTTYRSQIWGTVCGWGHLHYGWQLFRWTMKIQLRRFLWEKTTSFDWFFAVFFCGSGPQFLHSEAFWDQSGLRSFQKRQ